MSFFDSIFSFFSTEETPPEVPEQEEEDNLFLALAVLFMDLAAVDYEFDNKEKRFIFQMLQEFGGFNDDEVRALMNEAGTILSKVKDQNSSNEKQENQEKPPENVDQFAEILCERLPLDARERVFQIMKQVVSCDYEVDSYEKWLLQRYKRLLKVQDKGTTAFDLKLLKKKLESRRNLLKS